MTILYEVGFPSERARKDFYKILPKAPKRERERILEWFTKLAENPKPSGKSFKFLEGNIPIHRFLAQYRVREGDWRIFYDIDETRKRVVLLALRRRGYHAYD